MRETQRAIELRSMVRGWHQAGERVALVPTMGHLHKGHLRLIEEAGRRNDRVVVSLFVNPLQFDRQDDLNTYPRSLDEDRKKLEATSTDLLFLPSLDLIYPYGLEQTTRVHVPRLSEILEGEYRPGHFIGVATVICKLFQLVQPDDALFGEKDFQQLLLIQRMVQDLHIPVCIHGIPVVRAKDGLALSSRNSRLTSTQKPLASHLYNALSKARDLLLTGASVDAVEKAAAKRLQRDGFRVDYLTARHAKDMAVPAPDDIELVIVAAAWLGQVRLLDCVRVKLINDRG